MMKLKEKLRKIWNQGKEYFWTCVLLFFLLWIIFLPDWIYYHRPMWLAPNAMPLGGLCTFAKKLGFSYSGALETLKENFGILVTAIGIIITLSVNNLNRFENKIFGLTRTEFEFLKRLLIYKYGRRMVFLAPFVMIFAVNLNYCALGYGVLFLCYLFLIAAFFLFESSFSREKDLDCIIRKLHESVEPDAQDQEDIQEYRMLLNIMCQWNDKEKYWEGVNYLFCNLYDRMKSDTIEKKYILYYCFYQIMYMQDQEKDYDRALYALKVYISQRDLQGWSPDDYLLLWGMMHCFFAEDNRDTIVRFIKWYLDFAMKSRKLIRKSSQNDKRRSDGVQNNRLSQETVRMQTGVLLAEMELYFHRHTNREEIDDYIWEKIMQIWNEGRHILDTEWEAFRQEYLKLNALYDFDTEDMDKHLQNLCSDYQYGTTKSLIVYYVKLK